MPWFPDFVSAAELARRENRAAGQADGVAAYLAALDAGDPHVLEEVWPGDIVIYDPRVGPIRGHKALKGFVRHNREFRTERHASSEAVASTHDGRRAVVELLAHLTYDGQEVSWPLAVVAESPDDRSVVFRTYCSQWPVDGRRHVRPPILESGPVHLDDVIGRYQDALAAGDADAIVRTFTPDGYLREAIGPRSVHRGTRDLHAFFSQCFDVGGGIALERCAVTDDGVRCVLEYNCVRWGRYDVPPQAGLAVFERGPDGLLCGARFYDDVELPDGYALEASPGTPGGLS